MLFEVLSPRKEKPKNILDKKDESWSSSSLFLAFQEKVCNGELKILCYFDGFIPALLNLPNLLNNFFLAMNKLFFSM